MIEIGHWDPKTSTIVTSRRMDHVTGVAAPIYPFSVDSNDHCETPQIAYEHIVPFLQALALQKKKSVHNLHIWDPFFCAGSVAKHLNTIGFQNVYNENEDFYSYDEGKTHGPSAYDVLITNPPYTAQHIPNLLKFCKSSGKPCLLLLPNYVLHKFDQELRALRESPSSELFFVWSKARYKYKSPKFARSKDKARKDRVTSPFVSFWYCYVPDACGLLSTKKFQSEYASSVSKAKTLLKSMVGNGEGAIPTEEQKAAEMLSKVNFAASAKDLPSYLLDHKVDERGGSKRQHGNSSRNNGGKKNSGKKKYKRQKR